MSTNIDLATYDRLVFLIYQAALDPARWQNVLDEIRMAAGGLRTHMFGFDSTGTVALGNMWSGYDPAFIQSYRAHYGNVSPRAKGFVGLKPGEIVRAGELAPSDSYMRSEMYNDWIRPQDDMLGGGGGVLLRDRHRMLIFGGNIRAQDRERLEDDWLALARLLMPHLRQAFALGHALGTEVRQFASEQSRPGAATLLVSESGHVLDANGPASGLLEAGDILRSTSTSRVTFRNATANDLLYQSLQAVRRGQPASAAFEAGHDHAGVAYQCRLVHFVPDTNSVPQIILSMPELRPCLLLILTPQPDVKLTDHALAARYRLTGAELAVTQGIADGLTLRELADSRGVSIHTVRDQLKVALTKTGSRRQSDLVRLVTAARTGQ